MKTLKELYEIVKAAGGDFPFAVEWEGDQEHFRGGGPYLAFSETPSKNNIAIEDQDSLEIYSWADFTSMWQFPADSPYLEPKAGTVANAIKNLEYMAELEKTEANRQLWEDMGRPWGRLKKHAELINHNGKKACFVDYEPNYGKNGGVVSDQKQSGGLLHVNSGKESCTLTEKTLLNLDDWLLPESGWPKPLEDTCQKEVKEPKCKTCYDMKKFQWLQVRNGAVWVSGDFMPCPYCNPGAFK